MAVYTFVYYYYYCYYCINDSCNYCDDCRSIFGCCSTRTIEARTELPRNLPVDIFHRPYCHDISSCYLSQLEGASQLSYDSLTIMPWCIFTSVSCRILAQEWKHVESPMFGSSAYQDLSYRRIKKERTVRITLFIERVVCDLAPTSACLRSCWRQTFQTYDVNRCDLLHVDDFWENNCPSCL